LCLHIHTITFYFHLYRHHRDLHSFPTRRSSDLIPVMFQIPSDAAETNVSNMRDAIQWKLHAHADLPGVNYDAEFDVPVFRTKDRSEEHTSELQSPDHLVCRLLLEKKKKKNESTQ